MHNIILAKTFKYSKLLPNGSSSTVFLLAVDDVTRALDFKNSGARNNV